MCDPLSITLGAIAVGSQAVGGLAAAGARNKQSKAEQAAAAKAFTKTVGDIEAQRNEIVRAAVGERAQIAAISAQEKGTVQAAVAESGVEGSSPTMLSNQFDKALLEALQLNTENLSLKSKQLDREIEGAAAGAQSRMQAAQAQRPGALDYASIGLGAASAALPFIPMPQKRGSA